MGGGDDFFFFLIEEKLLLLLFTFSQISLEMSMLAAALAAKGNSIGSIPPFCLKIQWGPYFLLLPLQILDFLTATL